MERRRTLVAMCAVLSVARKLHTSHGVPDVEDVIMTTSVQVKCAVRPGRLSFPPLYVASAKQHRTLERNLCDERIASGMDNLGTSGFLGCARPCAALWHCDAVGAQCNDFGGKVHQSCIRHEDMRAGQEWTGQAGLHGTVQHSTDSTGQDKTGQVRTAQHSPGRERGKNVR